MKINTRKAKDLSSKQKGTMFALMDKYYSNLDEQVFLTDLSEKDVIFLLLNKKEEIVGFTSLKLFTKKVDQKNIVGVFSGDTVIDKKYRGGFELPYAWLSYSLGLNKNYDLVFWFMLSKGYRTYRLLPRFFKNFYPHYKNKTPLEIKNTIDLFATDLFGKDYDSETNIYKPAKNYNVKLGKKEVNEKVLKNPHLRFFATKNEFFWKGEELVSYCEISKKNLKVYAQLFYCLGTINLLEVY